LIRSSKRKTRLESCLSTFQVDVRSASAVRPVWCINPPKVNTLNSNNLRPCLSQPAAILDKRRPTSVSV
jgi:hypothetical protein